jgi:hypothetical protein
MQHSLNVSYLCIEGSPKKLLFVLKQVKHLFSH